MEICNANNLAFTVFLLFSHFKFYKSHSLKRGFKSIFFLTQMADHTKSIPVVVLTFLTHCVCSRWHLKVNSCCIAFSSLLNMASPRSFTHQGTFFGSHLKYLILVHVSFKESCFQVLAEGVSDNDKRRVGSKEADRERMESVSAEMQREENSSKHWCM